MYITFVGDVHGCYLSMLELLKKIPKAQNRIIFLGDLINKGKSSYQVFKFIKKNNYECILGNHEYYCINRNKKETKINWQEHGGKETEASIRTSLKIKSAQEMQVVLAEMSYFFETFHHYLLVDTQFDRRLVVTHGGISPEEFRNNDYSLISSLKGKNKERKPYFFNKESLAHIPQCIQIIGHQPTAYSPKEVGGNYFVDSGCVYDDRRGMGYLSAIMFNLTQPTPPQIFRQANID